MQSLLVCLPLQSEDTRSDVQKISEVAGYRIAQSLESPLGWYDLNAVVRGMQAYIAHDKSFANNDSIDKWQILYQLFEDFSEYNLKKTNQFLEKLSSSHEIIVLEKDKLMYELLQKGEGEGVVTAESTPLVQYSFMALDGPRLEFEDKMSALCQLSLNDVIPGFARGILGMKKGEQRKIYIHPDLAYGTTGVFLPNSLLIAEVTIISL